MPPTPERASTWLGLLLPLAQQGGPLLTLALALLLGGAVWYTLGALDRAVQRNHALVDKIILLQDSHRAELVRLAHCPPP